MLSYVKVVLGYMGEEEATGTLDSISVWNNTGSINTILKDIPQLVF